jgi:peptidoglycan/xylan/chitin deacetylase (PgdA/CDA1 family)
MKAAVAALAVCACLFASVDAASADARAAAVTFDDLPVISVTPLDATQRKAITKKLLASIALHKVPAVGFVNEYALHGFERHDRGAVDRSGVALLRMWLDAGLELGNHTFAHTDLHATSPAHFKQDIVLGEAVTAGLLQKKGRVPRYFRHPYLHTGRDLATREEIERFLAERGYRVAPVTVDNEDWIFAAAYSKAAARGDKPAMRRIADAYLRFTEQVFEYSEKLSLALFRREIRQVVLLHANALNADQFDALARMMGKRGYSFISLDAALEDEAYRSADAYTGEHALNWLDRWAVTRGVKSAENVLDDYPEVPAFVHKAADISASGSQ